MSNRGRIARLFLVAAFLCALIGAQAASLAFDHPHDSGHCCRLCHLGPLPFLQPISVAATAPVMAVAWLGGSLDSGSAQDTLSASASSRAPPSFFLA
jgi:hypothetical protein